MMVTTLRSLADVKTFLSKHQYAVIDVTADWCPPSRQFAPVFETLAQQWSMIKFAKVYGDDVDQFMLQHNVDCFPTFLFFKLGKEDLRLRVDGAERSAVVRSLERLSCSSKGPTRRTSRVMRLRSLEHAVSVAGQHPYLVIAVTVDWSMGARTFTPVFEELSSQWAKVTFAEISANDDEEVLWQLDIDTFPTFLFFKNGNPLHHLAVEGPNRGALLASLRDLCPLAPSTAPARQCQRISPTQGPCTRSALKDKDYCILHACPACGSEKAMSAKLCPLHASTDPAMWSASQLKQGLAHVGLDTLGYVDKMDLVRQARIHLCPAPGNAPAGRTPDQVPCASPQQSPPGSPHKGVDPARWSIAQLREALRATGVDMSHCLCKEDLVTLVRSKVVTAGPGISHDSPVAHVKPGSVPAALDPDPANWTIQGLRGWLEAQKVDYSKCVDKQDLVELVRTCLAPSSDPNPKPPVAAGAPAPAQDCSKPRPPVDHRFSSSTEAPETFGQKLGGTGFGGFRRNVSGEEEEPQSKAKEVRPRGAQRGSRRPKSQQSKQHQESSSFHFSSPSASDGTFGAFVFGASSQPTAALEGTASSLRPKQSISIVVQFTDNEGPGRQKVCLSEDLLQAIDEVKEVVRTEFADFKPLPKNFDLVPKDGGQPVAEVVAGGLYVVQEVISISIVVQFTDNEGPGRQKVCLSEDLLQAIDEVKEVVRTEFADFKPLPKNFDLVPKDGGQPVAEVVAGGLYVVQEVQEEGEEEEEDDDDELEMLSYEELQHLSQELRQGYLKDADAVQLQQQLRLILTGTANGAVCNLEAMKRQCIRRQLEEFLQKHPSKVSVDNHMTKYEKDYAFMWDKLVRIHLLPELVHPDDERRQTKVFVIGPGFGLRSDPAQYEALKHAGYQLHACWQNVADPEMQPGEVERSLGVIQTAIQAFGPHVVLCASKGGEYMVELWRRGWWTGPSVMINVHPKLNKLPANVNIVLAHGAADDTFPRPYAELYQLVQNSNGRCFLYYSGSDKERKSWRIPDGHDMKSLLGKENNLLARLVDAAKAPNPERAMMQSWLTFLSEERLAAENTLGFLPEVLQKYWVTEPDPDRDVRLVEVRPDGGEEERKEYECVKTMFSANPKVKQHYSIRPRDAWRKAWQAADWIRRIDRIENICQEEVATQYFKNLARTMSEDNYQAGVHVRWLFHGSTPEAIKDITEAKAGGFNACLSGVGVGDIWGKGIYFARDPHYPVYNNFCRPSAAQSSGGEQLQILCCLVACGPSCLGGDLKIFPKRTKQEAYGCAVDSLSNPEVFVVQKDIAVYPAYIITFERPLCDFHS